MPTYVTPDRRARALRLYAKVLPSIAEAVGVDPKTLHNTVLRRALFKNLDYQTPELPPSPPNEDTAGRSAGGVTSGSSSADTHKQEPAPMMVMRSAAIRAIDERVAPGLVTLRDKAGSYLNFDGTGTTTNRAHAYRGTIPQAKAMRLKSETAKGMTISHLTPKL